MKKIITFLFAIFFAPSISFAVPKYYIEGQINYTQVDDVDTNTFSGSTGGLTFTSFRATLDYDSDIGYGFEFGVSGLFDNDNLRFGLSYIKNEIEFKKATGSGTVSNGSTTVNFVSADRSDANSVELSFDNDVDVYSLNGYYDFNTVKGFRPFLGVGLGQADIQNAKDKELAMSFYAGGRFSINENAYVGIKGTYTRVDGPEDHLGFKYDDITAHAITLSVGYQF